MCVRGRMLWRAARDHSSNYELAVCLSQLSPWVGGCCWRVGKLFPLVNISGLFISARHTFLKRNASIFLLLLLDMGLVNMFGSVSCLLKWIVSVDRAATRLQRSPEEGYLGMLAWEHFTGVSQSDIVTWTITMCVIVIVIVIVKCST